MPRLRSFGACDHCESISARAWIQYLLRVPSLAGFGLLLDTHGFEFLSFLSTTASSLYLYRSAFRRNSFVIMVFTYHLNTKPCLSECSSCFLTFAGDGFFGLQPRLSYMKLRDFPLKVSWIYPNNDGTKNLSRSSAIGMFNIPVRAEIFAGMWKLKWEVTVITYDHVRHTSDDKERASFRFVVKDRQKDLNMCIATTRITGFSRSF
jgi:hypothetical protein